MNHKILAFTFCFHLFLLSFSQKQSASQEIIDLAKEAEENIYDDPARSLALAKEAYELSKPLNNDSLAALALNMIGSAHWSLGNPIEAMQNIQASLQICETQGYDEIRAKNLGNIGNVYSAAGFDLDAIDYHRLELQIQKKLKKNFRLFAINNNIGKSFLDLNYYDSARFYLGQASNYLDEESIGLASILYFNLAQLYFNEAAYEKSDSLLNLTFASAKEYDSRRGLARANQLMAELELIRNKSASAIKYAKEAMSIALESGVKELIYMCSKTLSKCHARLGQYDQAYLSNVQYEAYLDSVQNVTARNELELLSYYQRLFKFRVLETENTNNEETAEQRKWIIFGLILILVFVGILLMIIIRIRLKLERQKKELQGLNNFKTKVFGIVSHDLRSPIQSFIHGVDLLNRKMVTKEEIGEMIPELRERAHSLMGLLGNLLRWAGDQMESSEVSKEPFDFLVLLGELEDEFEEKLRLKEIAFIYDNEMRFRIFSNREIVKIILRNLLINAIKFSPEHSKIIIKTLEQNKKKVISVEDHGVGMDQETVNQLFSSEVASQVGTSGEHGSGLGLALCGDLVERLGGSIDVDSAINRGSSFHIILPEN